MPLYTLSYDVPENAYADLYTFLEDQKAVRILESVWLVPWGSESDGEALVEAASQCVDKDSRIIACEVFDDKHSRSWRNLFESDGVIRDLISRHARRPL